MNIALINFRAAGKACAQGVAREKTDALCLRQVGTQTSLTGAGLDQASDVFVRQPFACSFQAVSRRGDEKRVEVDLGVVQPLTQCMDRAGLVGGAACNFNLAPTGLAAQDDQRAVLQDLDPTAAVGRVVLPVVKAEISDRRRPPAKPISRMARSRRPRRSWGRVASMSR